MRLLDRRLTKAEIEYVWTHLAHHIEGFQSLVPYLCVDEEDKGTEGVFFPLSPEGFDLDKVVWHQHVPVLFPLDRQSAPAQIEGRLVMFRHDLLKSAFFLLSGYEEWAQPELKDHWGRFPAEASVLSKLNSHRLALVNYYFGWMADAMVQFALDKGLPVKLRNPLGRFTLNLSHDIDLLRYYSWRKTIYRMAQLIGLRRLHMPWTKVARAFVRSLGVRFGLRASDNPYWSFGKMFRTELHYGFRSSWFFLPSDGSAFDADYRFSDADVAQMMKNLLAQGHEIGLHPSCGAAESDFVTQKKVLEQIVGVHIAGVRMHFLRLRQPATYVALQRSGFRYDCSLGYPLQDGFRAGYCFPFHPFDHHAQRPLTLWELPLMAMDTTFWVHQKLTEAQFFESIETLVSESKKFGGLFSLLWHNSTFDELQFPGMLKTYEDLHLYLSQQCRQSLTAAELLDRMDSFDASIDFGSGITSSDL